MKVMYILLVEDNTTAAIGIKGILRQHGAKIDHAKDGEEAVSLATSNKYDLILMDIGLPIFNGIEATRKIRSADVNTPIVALTANLAEFGLPALKDAGMCGGYDKPLTAEKLAEIFELVGLTPSA